MISSVKGASDRDLVYSVDQSHRYTNAVKFCFSTAEGNDDWALPFYNVFGG